MHPSEVEPGTLGRMTRYRPFRWFGVVRKRSASGELAERVAALATGTCAGSQVVSGGALVNAAA
jgi:hypothetical protein